MATPPPAVQARRAREFSGARTRAEVDELHRRWLIEDAALAEATDGRAGELAALRGRVEHLERLLLSPDRKRIGGPLVAGLGDALGRVRREIEGKIDTHRREIDGELTMVRHRLDDGIVLRYRGTWDELQSYMPGALVSYAGSGWIAIAAADKGERPGKGAAWRLALKSSG